jgi:hypothetical protein
MWFDSGGERDGWKLRTGKIESVNCLRCDFDGLSDLLLCLTLCSFLSNLKEQPRKLARFGLGYLAVGPRVLQWLHKEIAGPMRTRLAMAVKPLCELVKLVICEFAILNDGAAYQKKFAGGRSRSYQHCFWRRMIRRDLLDSIA